jgi:hypothetical protein
MSSPVVLWIDAENNKLSAGWNSFVYASKPLFKQGDEVPVTLRWIKRPTGSYSSMEEVSFGNKAIGFNIGNLATKPVAGKWYLKYDGESTELLDYDVSEGNLENALNMVQGVVTAGGVSVSKLADDAYKVIFMEDGEQEALTGFGDGLSPISNVIVREMVAGSVERKAVYLISLRQASITDVTSNWVTEPAVTAVATSLKANLWDISLTGQPKGGSFAITINNGTQVSVPVFSDANELEALIGAGSRVVKEGDFRWRVSYETNANFTLAIASSANIISFSGKTASVLIKPNYTAEMLSGVVQTSTTLQITVSSNGSTGTILQTPCTVVGNLTL